MINVKASPPREYINVMELLVAEEVEQQLRQLPTRVLKYIKSIEVETYALNRLPSLYAASEKGWHSQYQKAKYELGKEISGAVRRAIAAVQVDPLRASRPLVHRLPSVPSDNAVLLEQFRAALGQPHLTWESLLRKCKRAGAARREAIDRHSERHPAAATSANDADEQYAAAYVPEDHGAYGGRSEPNHHSDHHGTVWRPGTYGETSWRPKRHHSYQASTSASSSSGYDWNDSRYR
ncbi:MAG: late competence development ComFB family protein [Cyanobacteria bacterium P01_A01_bin.137]